MAKWLDNAVFYQIYPQSFKDSNGDGIGDLPGILEKLDDIRELGCNALWLNPCFQSPFGDGGYDISDYYTVAPRYGSNPDLKNLFEAVHKRDMHILLDLVPGHTSVEHPWFQESRKAEANPWTNRYVWTDSIWEHPGADCLRGISDRDGACVVNYFSNQPALNYGYYKVEKSWQQPVDAPGPLATLAAMEDVMNFWLKMGCDGFRVDMADSLVKNDPEGKGTIALWQKVRAFLDREYPEAVLVSEWGDPDKSLRGGFHMDFLLHFGPSHYNDLFRCEKPWFSSKGGGDISQFVKRYEENRQKNKNNGLICIPSGNHDMCRLAKHLQGDELKLAFAFLLSMPGVPFIYYGDEIGMRQVEGLKSVEGGYSRTGARTPMQWDETTNAGFSLASPERLYIPLDASPDRPTVQGQKRDKDSLYHQVKQLIAIRQAHQALLNRGNIFFVHVRENACPLVYLRSQGEEKILVVLNPSSQKTCFEWDQTPKETLYCLGGPVQWDKKTAFVPPCSAGFYLIQHAFK